MAGGANRVAPCVIRPTVSGASGFRFLVRAPKMLRVVSAIFYFFERRPSARLASGRAMLSRLRKKEARLLLKK
jgi:hypothetical protein